jgi:hypothetical protein
VEQCQFTNGVVHQGQPKTRIDQLRESIPCQRAAVEFQAMVPQLRVFEQVEHDIWNPLVARRAANAELALTLVQPWQSPPPPHVVELWKFELVCRRNEIFPRVFFFGINMTTTLEAMVRILKLALHTSGQC